MIELCDEILNVLSVYAPETGLDNSIKDFNDSLLFVTSGLPDNGIVMSCDDLNRHVGKVQLFMKEFMGSMA